MKKSIVVRILAALGGLMLWAFGFLVLAETFFHVPFTEGVKKVLFSDTPLAVLLTLLVAIVMFALGVCCLMMLFPSRSLKSKGYVMQKSENGVIGVSVKSIEGLVQTCVAQHEMVAKAEISVVERRDGIVILLNIEEAAGLNIPLAVGALQKQIKEYVGTCTGVDVQEVRVMVENTEDDAAGSPYAVEKPVLLPAAASAPEEQSVEESVAAEEAPAEEPAPVEEMPAEEEAAAEVPTLEIVPDEEPDVQEITPAVSVPVMPVMPELPEEEDDRPLHQRLFGAEEQPVFVPAPPELVIEPQAEEAVAEIAGETGEASAEEAEPADEIAADAVLEVVEAIAQEAEIAGEEDISAQVEYDEEVLAEEALLDGDEEIRE